MNEHINFDDIVTPRQFAKEFPHLVDSPGCPRLHYLMRTRYLNGLTDCGAVIEPVQRRPMIVKPKFLKWLLNRKVAA